MRLVSITAYAFAALFFTACSSDNKEEANQPLVFLNDAEIGDWLPGSPLRENPITHSGKFVSVIDGINVFSLGLSKQIKKISEQPMDSVLFSYWVYLKSDNANAVSVISIENAQGKSVHWEGLSLRTQANKLNKWIQVNEKFKIPSNTDKNNTIKLYVLNQSTEEILLDDFKVEFK